MKKSIYLIVLVLILGLTLTGCSLLSNVGQVPVTNQSGITSLTKGDPDVECPAAPAVAGLLLEAVGVDNRWGTGRDGGNYIKEVANHMGTETDFDGIERCEVFEYKLAIVYFLNSIGAAVAYPENVNVVESVIFNDVDGDGKFGSEIGDTVIITFKGNIIKEGDITADFAVNHPIISHGAKTDWDITDNVLTFTINTIFTSPRPITGEYLISIDGLVDSVGHSVVVPYGGVEVQTQT